MKIRQLILMFVLLLACGNVWAQYTLKSITRSDGNGRSTVVTNDNAFTVTFGDGFFVDYGVKVNNRNAGNDSVPVEPDKCVFYISSESGSNVQKSGEELKKLPVGTYKFRLSYAPNSFQMFSLVSEDRDLIIVKRNVTLSSEYNFSCEYNGSTEFGINEFVIDPVDNVTSDEFVDGCKIENLASFDATTKIDFDNSIVRFASKNAGVAKEYGIGWQIKSTSSEEDWTANYEFSDGSGRGNIHPRPISANVTVSSKVYDGTPAVLSEQNIVGDIALDNVVQGDDIAASVVWSSIYGSLSYESEGVGDNKKINGFENASLITLSGVDAGNYQITEVDAKSSITAKPACPFEKLGWSGVSIENNVATLVYGESIGTSDNSTYTLFAYTEPLSVSGFSNAVYEYKKVNESDNLYKQYVDGSIIYAGTYNFKATFTDANDVYEDCKLEPLTVVVEPRNVNVKISCDNITKFFDDNTSVFCDGNQVLEAPILELPSSISLDLKDFHGSVNSIYPFDNDEVVFDYSIEYEDENVGFDKNVVFNGGLDGDVNIVNSYKLIFSELKGSIEPITPFIAWHYNSNDFDDHSTVTIPYGTLCSSISASFEKFNEYDDSQSQRGIELIGLYYTQLPYVLTQDGLGLDISEIQRPGNYTLSVVYHSDDEANMLTGEGYVNVVIEQVPIELSIRTTSLQFGASVGEELTYIATNLIEGAAIGYEYYIDGEHVDAGFVPSVGSHTFGCKAHDENGYMLDGDKTATIVITKAGGYFKIDEPVIEEYKTYDGDYYAKVVTPAKFGDIEFETTAYYVDKSITESTEISDEYFRSDVGTYYICYKFIIPEEVLEQYNLCIDSYEDDNGNIQYVPYVSGSYRYHNDGCKPGSIRCGSLELEVEFPTADHSFTYGDEFMLGGSRNQDVKVYTKMVNGDYVFNIDGEFEFADFSVNPYTPLAYPLYVNTYNNIQVRLTVPDGSNYCGMFESAPFDFTVTPKPLTFEGDFVIADKTYDGSDIINSDGVNGNLKGGDFVQSQFPETQQIRSVPNVVGILASDKPYVTAVWDFSDTKYPSAEVKYTDDTQSEVAAYTGIPASVSLTGSRAYNYKLPDNTTVYGSSKINPAIQIEFESPEQPEEVLTYRLVYGNSVLGEDFKVKDELVGDGQYVRYIQDGRYDRTFLMQSPKVNSDDYYNFEAQIVEGNREDDMYKDNVKIIASQKFKLYVDRLKLVVSEPEIEKIKLYDGNTSVKWIDDNNKCRLTNVVGDDDVRLEDIDIQYDSPEVGGGKTITARYAVGGNHLYKYILPDDYSTVGAISSGDVTIVDVTPVTGDGGSGTVSPNNDGYCAGEDIMLNIKISEGIPVGCSIEFDDAAKKAGFENVTNANVVDAGDGVYQVTIDCPKAAYGKYGGKLYLEDFTGKESDGFSFEIMVNYPSKYLRQKFDDVILVDNHFMSDNEQQHLFSEYNPDVSYQWYVRNDGVDTDITGETKQFYNTTTPGVYGAYALTSSGERIKICPIKFPIDNVSKSVVVSKSVTTYPNPARSMETVTIKLHGFDSDSYKDVVIYVYNSVGSIVTTIKNVDVLNTVNLPSGNYSGIVVFDGNKIPFKFIVRN